MVSFFSYFLGKSALFGSACPLFGSAGRKFVNFRKYIRYISVFHRKINIPVKKPGPVAALV
jgi:hypothetical protein